MAPYRGEGPADNVDLLARATQDAARAVYPVERAELLRSLWAGRGGLVGIRNRGNSCFMAAVLQVLLRVRPFAMLLEAHASVCDEGEGRRCLPCLLWRDFVHCARQAGRREGCGLSLALAGGNTGRRSTIM